MGQAALQAFSLHFSALIGKSPRSFRNCIVTGASTFKLASQRLITQRRITMKSIKLVVLALIALAAGASAWTQDGIPRPEKPVAQLEAQTARDPNNPRLLQQIGTAYFYQARDGNVAILAKAIAALERSVALAPDDAASQRTLGVAYLMK